MKTAIVGSRSFNDYKLMKNVLNNEDIRHIISGGAKGADSLAQRYARVNSIPITIYYPNWGKYGKRAGYIRNIKIVHNSDRVIAFWDGKSKGTKHTIDYAKEQHRNVKIINYKKEDNGKDSE